MKQVVTDSHQILKQLEREFQFALIQILDCFPLQLLTVL